MTNCCIGLSYLHFNRVTNLCDIERPEITGIDRQFEKPSLPTNAASPAGRDFGMVLQIRVWVSC